MNGLTGVDYPGTLMDITLQYDELERLTNVVDRMGSTKFSYTAAGKESGGTTRLHEQLSCGYDASWNLVDRTNNVLHQVFNVNNRNELTSANRSGTLTVAGTTTSVATNVTVNGWTAELYADDTFAKSGFGLQSGDNTSTAIAKDDYGPQDTNSVTVNLPATVTPVPPEDLLPPQPIGEGEP